MNHPQLGLLSDESLRLHLNFANTLIVIIITIKQYYHVHHHHHHSHDHDYHDNDHHHDHLGSLVPEPTLEVVKPHLPLLLPPCHHHDDHCDFDDYDDDHDEYDNKKCVEIYNNKNDEKRVSLQCTVLKSTKWKESLFHNVEFHKNGREMSHMLACVVLTQKVFEKWKKFSLCFKF